MTLTSDRVVGKVCRKGRKTISNPLCSTYVTKNVTFGSSNFSTIFAVHSKKKTNLLGTFHTLYTTGMYARYLGYGMHQGVQTISMTAMKYMAMYPEKVPSRQSLGIKINFIGDKAKIAVDKEHMLTQQYFYDQFFA